MSRCAASPRVVRVGPRRKRPFGEAGIDETLRFESSDEPVDRRAGQTDPIGDLGEAETGRLSLERQQDPRRALDDLNAAAVASPDFLFA